MRRTLFLCAAERGGAARGETDVRGSGMRAALVVVFAAAGRANVPEGDFSLMWFSRPWRVYRY